MIQRIARLTIRPVMTAFSVLVVTLSVYIMAGRVAMTFAGDWAEEVEALLTTTVGMPVRIGSLQGGWQGFGPSLTAGDVRLTGPGNEPVLSLSRVSLSLDMPASLLNWQWMAGRIQLRDLDVTVRERLDGRWQLDGLGDVSATLSPGVVFELMARVGDLEILDTRAQFVSVDQRTLQFDDLALLFQSRGNRHYLQVDAWLPGDPRRIAVQAALEGQRLDALSGSVHARLPQNDFGLFAGLLGSPDLQVLGLEGGMELRADLAQSRPQSLDVDFKVPGVTVHQRETGSTIRLESLQGALHYRRSEERDRMRVAGFRVARDVDQ